MYRKVVKPPKIKLIIWGGVFLLQLSFLRIISSYPSKVEALYSSLFYPYLFTFQSTFFNFFSFSLGDIFYAIASVFWFGTKSKKMTLLVANLAGLIAANVESPSTL